MKEEDNSPLAEASAKFKVNPVNFQFDLPMLEMMLQTKAEVEALSAQAGLKIIHHFLEEEIRQWKAATTTELQKLVQRPVPADLVALLIDGQYFRKQCLIVALGVDKQAQKHVLGLWEGATENSTLVRELLADLRERGLNTEAAMLVVVDGAKALYKGVREVFGERALIQRCRVHKLRNVLEHLPVEKRSKAAWRLRDTWAKGT